MRYLSDYVNQIWSYVSREISSHDILILNTWVKNHVSILRAR